MPTPLRNAWRRPRNLPLAKLAPGYVADVSDVPFRTSIAASVGSTPTLTRALAATVVDHEGIVRTAKSGELRFSGLRRVENLLTYSQDFSNAAWTKNTSTVSANNATAPDGTFSADLITSADEVGVYQNIAVTPGVVYTASVFFKKDTCTIYRLRDASDGHHVIFTVATKTFSGPSNVISYGYQELSNGWFRIWMTYTAVGSTSAHNLRPNSQAGSTSYWQWGVQLENVTGQAVQTPGEYVSNEVLSSPWHSAGVDGVKYFNTTLAGVAFANVPRCLVESSRTNLLTYSEQFDDASWTKGATTVSANNATAPDGGFTADLITSADEVGIYQAFAVTPGVVYTASVFFKKNTCTIYRLRDVSDDHHVIFTVATKTFSGPSNVISYNYQEFPNGWFRIWMTYTAVGSFSAHTLRPSSQAGSTSYWQWGAQLEVGSRPSSYIPTLASAVTRPVDVLAQPISVGNTGTWVVTVSPAEVPASAGLYPMVSLQAPAGNQIGLFMQPGASTLGLSVFTNGVQLVYGSIQSSVVAGGVYRVALSWSAANRRISYCVNGGTPGAVTGVDMPQALTSFSTAASNPWIGTVADSEIFTVEHPPETLKLMSAL